jgi:hypothetical protein
VRRQPFNAVLSRCSLLVQKNLVEDLQLDSPTDNNGCA